jgi:ABC-type antimicrobial peptide transport system permease subunit
MALGASAPQILGSVAREGVMLSALGAAAGLAGAAVVSTWLRDLLDEVGPFDGATLIGVTGLVAIVAVVSAISTAWRAARVDPVAALRAE